MTHSYRPPGQQGGWNKKGLRSTWGRLELARPEK
jgi:hypothetical protein